MSISLSRTRLAGAAMLALGCASLPVQASLTLTSDAVGMGFSLSTFATLNPGSTGYGPFGMAVTGDGHVLVSNYPNGQRYVFDDVDGQTPATALASLSSGSSTVAYATVGGLAYGGEGGHFVQFKSNGAVDHVLTGVGASTYLGMWGNLTNGHIIATSSGGLIDIDPLANGGTGSSRVIASAYGDGVSVSPDGKTAFLAQGSGFSTYNIATGNFGYSVSGIAGADGMGVISSSNALNGNVVVNTNYGEVWMYDPTSQTKTLLANGGTRGDYVSPDTSNGTLFLAYSDNVMRLNCGAGCGIGSPPPVPEPESVALVLGGMGVVALVLGRRRRKA